MTSQGVIRAWHEDDGWGVIDSEVTPGGCWLHYSSVLVAGYKSLREGQEVEFDFEAVEQDGYPFRAIEAWPAGQEPVRVEAALPEVGPTGFFSALTLTFDNGDEPLRF